MFIFLNSPYLLERHKEIFMVGMAIWDLLENKKEGESQWVRCSRLDVLITVDTGS